MTRETLRRLGRRAASLLLAACMACTAVPAAFAEEAPADPVYTVEVTADKTEVTPGETVQLTATVKKDGTAMTDAEMAAEDLRLWFWSGDWSPADKTSQIYSDTTGTIQTVDVTLPEAGTYIVQLDLKTSGDVWKASTNITLTAQEQQPPQKDTYAITVTADKTDVTPGETVTLTAEVTKNGQPVTDLAAEGLDLWFWPDQWAAGHEDGLVDVKPADNSGKVLSTTFTLPMEGTYYLAAELKNGSNREAIAFATIKVAEAVIPGYSITVEADKTELEKGGTVTLTATVKNNGVPVTDLAAEGLELWFWPDIWSEGHTDGLGGVTPADNTGKVLSTTFTLPEVGTYYLVAQLKAGGEEFTDCVTITTTEPIDVPTPVEGGVTVEYIPGLQQSFIRGVDISSVMAEFKSGVTFKDYDGNTISNVTDFCRLLADNGVTHVRVRVWNDPYDENGNGYGGGNNDVATAVEIAKGCNAAGLKMLVDFHCSDLWTDPGKQQAPKAFAGMSAAEKGSAQASFIVNALTSIEASAPDVVDMIQIGNETSTGFMGVWASDPNGVEEICQMVNACSAAVRNYDPSIKLVFHVTNPEKGMVKTWGDRLRANNVDYDILATSCYPYWHGSLTDLKKIFADFKAANPGKDVMVAETSYAYTLDDTDGHSNTVRLGNNDTGANTTEPFTVQGQATALRNMMAAVHEAGGLGVFYWEPAWITVGDTYGKTGAEYDAQVAANKAKWEEFGSGWAASYAAGYDPNDAGKWYGGSAVDNEAMFYPDGTPTEALPVWKYVFTGSVSDSVQPTLTPGGETIALNGTYTLPQTVPVSYSNGTESQDPVVWNEEDVAAIDVTKAGEYTVRGTVTLSIPMTTGYDAFRGKGTTADTTYVLTVEPENLINGEDASFQTNNFTLDHMDIQSSGDSKDEWGNGHWWLDPNASSGPVTGTATYNQPITLEPGKYIFEVAAQGKEGDTAAVQILDETGAVLFEGTPADLAGWANWQTASVDFTVEEPTTVTLRVSVVMQPDGWGTVDLLRLYKYADLEEPQPDPTPAPTAKPETGSTAAAEAPAPTAAPKPAADDNAYTTCQACGYHNWTETGEGYRCDHCGHLITQLPKANVKRNGSFRPAATIPQTGDDLPVVWLGVLTAAGMLGLGVTAVSRKRRNK